MFAKTLTALLGLAAVAFAQDPTFDPVYTPLSGEEIEVGTTYKITWSAPDNFLDGTIKLHLIGGDTQNTQVYKYDIAAGVPNSALSYDWAIPTTESGLAFYGIVVTWEADTDIIQYSNPFKLVAGDDEPLPEEPEEPKPTDNDTNTEGGADATKTISLSSVETVTTSCTTTFATATSSYIPSVTSSYVPPPAETPIVPPVDLPVPTETSAPVPIPTGAAGKAAPLALLAIAAAAFAL